MSELQGDEFAKSDKSIIDQVADFFYSIGGERFVAIAIVNEAKEKYTHRFYLHEVVIQKSLQSEEFKTGMATKANN